MTIIAPGFVRTKVGKKKKSRPFRVELEPATRLMHRAIVCRKPYYAFPKTLVALLWLAGMLPASIYDRALASRGPESGGRGSDPPIVESGGRGSDPPIAEAVAHIWLDRPD